MIFHDFGESALAAGWLGPAGLVTTPFCETVSLCPSPRCPQSGFLTLCPCLLCLGEFSLLFSHCVLVCGAWVISAGCGFIFWLFVALSLFAVPVNPADARTTHEPPTNHWREPPANHSRTTQTSHPGPPANHRRTTGVPRTTGEPPANHVPRTTGEPPAYRVPLASHRRTTGEPHTRTTGEPPANHLGCNCCP